MFENINFQSIPAEIEILKNVEKYEIPEWTNCDPIIVMWNEVRMQNLRVVKCLKNILAVEWLQSDYSDYF